jgi:hypothetical protein
MAKSNEMLRNSKEPTSFLTIYNAFFSIVTDDMYMELTKEDTYHMLQDILLLTLPRFEFPRFNIFDYDEGAWGYYGEYSGVESDYKEVAAYAWIGGSFNTHLTLEEINIIALNMVVGWLMQQLDSTENTKQIYTGSDFKMTSQANHMAKLKVLIDSHKTDSLHLQRLYKRRIVTADGKVQSTMGSIVTKPKYGFKI